MTAQGPYFTELIRPTPSVECNNKIKFIQKTQENNLLGFLQNRKEYSIFNHMMQLANMAGKFNSRQMYMTLFVVSDEDLKKQFPESVFINMDLLTARKILLHHTLDRNVSLDMLKSSRGMFLTNKTGDRLLFTQDSENNMHINRDINIYDKIEIVNNAIILFTDKIIVPHDLSCGNQSLNMC